MHTHPGGANGAAGANTDKLLILMLLFSQNHAVIEEVWFGKASVKTRGGSTANQGPTSSSSYYSVLEIPCAIFIESC